MLRRTTKNHSQRNFMRDGLAHGLSHFETNEDSHHTSTVLHSKKVTTMEFQKYSSIQNSYRKTILDEFISTIETGHCIDDFIVEEKAHGSNFAFYYNGSELRTASRSKFLEKDGENFNKSHIIKEKYTNAIHKLYTLLGGCGDNDKKENTSQSGGPTCTAIRVVGEMIGGSYPHPDVKSTSLPQIQKEVKYCPGLEFYAFDLYVKTPNDAKIPTKDNIWHHTKMDRLEMYRLFELAGLFYAKPLFRGTLKECLDFPNTFQSHIPGWLGLPPPLSDNIAEGKVIKPFVATYLRNDEDGSSSSSSSKSIILKDKAEKFQEVLERKTKKITNISEEAQNLADILCSHITSNRLSNT